MGKRERREQRADKGRLRKSHLEFVSLGAQESNHLGKSALQMRRKNKRQQTMRAGHEGLEVGPSKGKWQLDREKWKGTNGKRLARERTHWIGTPLSTVGE